MNYTIVNKRLQKAIWIFFSSNVILTILLVLCAAFAHVYVTQDNSSQLTNDIQRLQRTAVQTYSDADIRRVTLGKSVFRTNRVVAVKASDEAGRFILKGISGTQDKKTAYIYDTKRKKRSTVREGDMIGLVRRVISISDSEVTYRQGSEEYVLIK